MTLTLPKRQRTLAVAGVGLSIFMFTLDMSIVNVAMPTLVRELHTGFDTVQWVALGYLLIHGSLILAAARLGDLLDRKRFFMGGLALFTFASMLCGTAPSIGLLVAYRVLQGLGGVVVSALGSALVTEITPPEERGRALGMMGGIIAIGVAIGPTVGGVLLSLFTWHSLFLVNVPVGLAILLLLGRVLPPGLPRRERQPFDLVGALGISGILCGLAVGLNAAQDRGFQSPFVLGVLGATALGFPLVLSWEAHQRHPLLPLEMFRDRSRSLGLGLAVLTFLSLSGTLFLMPFFLELVKGYSPGMVGALLAVSPTCTALVSPFAGWVADHVGERPVTVVGLALMSLGCLLVSTFDASLTPARYVLSFLPFGLGLGIFQAPNNSTVMGSVPRERLGTASGLLSLSRTLGQSTGLPLTAALFLVFASLGTGQALTARVELLPPEGLVAGVEGTFRAWAAVLLGASLLSALLPRGGGAPSGSRAAPAAAVTAS